jgi:hypothetical protein
MMKDLQKLGKSKAQLFFYSLNMKDFTQAMGHGKIRESNA